MKETGPEGWYLQVVVLAGGTNDFISGFQPLPIQAWRSQVLEFIDTVSFLLEHVKARTGVGGSRGAAHTG